MRKFLIALLYLSFFITNTFAQCSTFGVAKFSFSPANGCSVPKTIFFTDQSLLPDTWLWDFGDGSTSTAQNPIHTFTSVGDFTVKLTVVNTTYGCTSFITKVVSISAPNADFTATKTFGCGPLTTTFNDSSTGASQWDWDFGDGNTSTAQNPTHIYSSPGTYNVKLIITASNGCTSTKTRSNYIQVIGPDTKFSANTTSGNKPLTVNFSNETTASSPIVGWLWNFGDGNTSTSQNPTHTYTSAGNYTVSLKIDDLDGCSRTLTKTAFIEVNETTLPITLLSFEVKPQMNTTLLQWKTASEKHNKTFIISKSTDGVVYKEIGRVAGRGDTIGVMNYSFEDTNLKNGVNYYRLEQQDLDGSINNLGLKAVDFDWNNTSVVAFPNPTNGKTTINLSAGKFDEAILTNINGDMLQSKNIKENSTSVSFSLINYPHGFYFIQIKGDENKQVKVIKR